MSDSKLLTLFVVSAVMLVSCKDPQQKTDTKREKDPALQVALDELTRLNSYTETGLNYSEYSERLLTTKGNIDVAIQRVSDERAKTKITDALEEYVRARESWKRAIDLKISPRSYLVHKWNIGAIRTREAAEFVFADEAARGLVEEKYRMPRQKLEKAMLAEYERKEQEKNEREAKALESEKLRQEAKKKAVAEEAERERLRRFAPEGTVYNVKRITITTEDGLNTIPLGTELTVTKKNSDGTLHVQKGALAADVPPKAVTNDRDLLAAVRVDDKQKNAKQAADAVHQDLVRRYKAIKDGGEQQRFLDSLPIEQRNAVLFAD